MSKPKFDPSKPFEASKPKFNPDEKFDAVPDASEQSMLGKAYDTASDFAASIGEGNPLSGVATKAAAGVAALIPQDGKSYGERYDDILAMDKAQSEARAVRSPIASTAGEIAGAVAGGGQQGVVAAGAKGLLPAAGRVAGNITLSSVDAASRKDNLKDALDAGEDAGELSGLVSAGVESLPVVGKAAKFAKRLIPATEDAFPAVNKVATVGAKLLGKGEQAEQLYSDVAGRRAARSLNTLDEATHLAPQFDEASEALEKGVGKRYGELQEQAIKESAALPSDIQAFTDVAGEVGQMNATIEANGKDFFNPKTRSVFKRVGNILDGVSPEEAAATRGTNVGLAGDLEVDSQMAKDRILRSRRELDDIMRDKDFGTMATRDRQAVMGLRANLNQKLQTEFAGGERMGLADNLYGDFKDATAGTFDKLKDRSTGYTDVSKLDNAIKTGTGKGITLDQNFQKLDDFMGKYSRELGDIPEVQSAMESIAQLRELANNKRVQNSMDVLGGPSGSAINLAATLAGAGGTKGASLLLLPITNPALWSRIVDESSERIYPILMKIQQGTQGIVQRAPSIAVRAATLREKTNESKKQP